MELLFWLMDVSTEQVDGRDEIWLWSVDSSGERCILRVLNQKQRFYVAFEREDEAKALIEEVSEKTIPGLTECKLCVKKSFGVKRHAVMIECEPSRMDEVVRIVKRMTRNGSIYEDDIRFSSRFLLDNDVSPSSWYSAEVEESDLKLDGVKSYTLKSFRKADVRKCPELRIIGVDFVYGSLKGSPVPERDPVSLISVSTSEDRSLQFSGDEKRILVDFMELIDSFDPDIIVGYRLNSLHWPYLLERCNRLGLRLSVGRLASEPHQSVYGHFSVAGRINFDLRDYVDDIAVIQRKTLEELAEYLGVEVDVEPIDEFLYPIYWRDEREKLIEYSAWRAKACREIFEKISDYVFSLSAITGIPSDHVFTASPGYRLENYLMRSAVKLGELIPKVREKHAPSYPGGKVLSPKTGLHSKVAVVDFKSMYPSLMLKYNISPDTVKQMPFKYDGELIEVPETNTCIIQDRRGFFTDVLEKLVSEREAVRRELKKCSRDSPEYRFLDASQKTLKVLANAMYGYMGWIGARWYLREGAETVTALGRRVITETINRAREMGLEVIYGDTDSLFVKYEPEKVSELLRWINEDLGLEAKIDKVYEKVIFTEAKKRYAGLTVEGELDVVGLEAVRGDWCNYAKKTQRTLLEMLLRGAGKDKLISYVRERVINLRRRKVDLMDLVIWKQLAKKISEYEVNAPHVVIASKLIEEGWMIDKGDFVGFVVVKGSGPLYNRVKHYSKADLSEIDLNYYVEKQILPVCARILGAIGVRKKELENVVKVAGLGMEAFF